MKKAMIMSCEEQCQPYVMKIKYPKTGETEDFQFSLNRQTGQRFCGEWVADFPGHAMHLTESELELLLKMGVRAEQQAFAKFGLDFVMEEYLPAKLKDVKRFLP